MFRRRRHSFRLPVIGVWLDAWRGLRRLLSGAEWSARLSGLPRYASRDEHGLILIQIDGLARHELERALAGGRMPRLRRLLGREGYRLHDVYSGLPSTTPAAQGELFYGRKTAVPAFVFVDRARGETVKMISTDVAAGVEASLRTIDPGLLRNGSAYSNIYTGGASEPHFCAAALGWNGTVRRGNFVSLLLVIGWNLPGIVRIVLRLLLELARIVVDLVRALFGRLDFKREFEFVPSRLGVGVVLEELITMAACVDAARGLPVVQLNYLSYDEWGHLRGPGSRFAHEALTRIDASIGRIWNAAHLSAARHYAVWVYSDHGQEETTPYDDLAGQTTVAAVQQVFRLAKPPEGLSPRDASLRRLSYLRGRRKASSPARPVGAAGEPSVKVAAIGPVGHIYLTPELAASDLAPACRELATTHHVPLVVRLLDDERLRLWTAAGEFEWPRDAARFVGADHPFARELLDDLPALCRHPNAGDVVILGWHAGRKPISFVKELGAHGGIGPGETSAFALLPVDAPRTARHGAFLRLDDLRKSALEFLGRATGERPTWQRAEAALRVVSYNVHSCVGLDGRLSPGRIARVLAHCDADVIALQELDVNRPRTGLKDQAHEIARLLGLDQVLFHPAISHAEEHYGDAILSRLPLRLVRAAALPGSHLRRRLEPRGAVWAAVEFAGQTVQLVNTHLGLLAEERRLQVEALLGPQWTGHAECRDPVVLLGDFNAAPGSAPYRQIVAEFRDCQNLLPGHRPRKTWFSPYPLARIDHVFVRGDWNVAKIEVPRTHLTAVASDHLPLVVELTFAAAPAHVEPATEVLAAK